MLRGHHDPYIFGCRLFLVYIGYLIKTLLILLSPELVNCYPKLVKSHVSLVISSTKYVHRTNTRSYLIMLLNKKTITQNNQPIQSNSLISRYNGS